MHSPVKDKNMNIDFKLLFNAIEEKQNDGYR